MKSICPRCNTGLARRWAGKALYQLCVNCHGIAITRHGLAGIADPGEVQVLWTQAMGDSVATDLNCPSCLKGMIAAYSHDGKRGLELDLCSRCQLFWFDKGEYEGLHNGMGRRIPQETAPLVEKTAPASVPPASDDSYGGGTILLTLMGLPVEEDVGVLARTPIITRALFVFVVACSVWGFTHQEAMDARFVFRYSGDPLRMFATSLSSFFFHGGWWHLLGNMYFFLVFGDDVENELGHEQFLLFLAAAATLGNVLYCLSPNSSTGGVIGASGGIAGLISYYMIRFPSRRFRVMFFFRIFQVNAWMVGAFYFLLDLVGAVSQLSGRSHVSHLSHLGGALMGIAVALLMKVQDRNAAGR